ncbi:MAG: hypothetical protein AABY32_00355 [Nanoarchaeota archaeon]
MAYGCFGYGMMNGSYGFGWILFSWLMGLLIIAGLVLFIIWIFKKIQNESNKSINKHIKR